MNGTDEAIVQALLAFLPEGESVDAEGLKQLETARQFMAELFCRGISSRRFDIETGLTGFPVFPEQPGMTKQQLMSRGIPVYYTLWLTDKDATVSATAIKNNLLFLKERNGEWANQYAMQLYIDIDSENLEYPNPIEGLTHFAQCMEFNLADADEVFADIDQACARVAPHAQQKLRIGLGTFGPDEYKGLSGGSLFSSLIPFDMGSEWLMFKNIHRRVGRFGWFWRWVSARQDRKDKAA